MLVEFRVKNFRSFKDEQVFSMAAATDKAHRETHVTDTGVLAVPGLLRSAVLYGPNAGGKSNFMKAISFMKGVVITSAMIQPGQPFNVPAFRLDPTRAHTPTEFEVTFLDEGVRYQYGFALTTDRIVEEWLLVYKTAKAQTWFIRRYNDETSQDEYEFSLHLKGQRRLWQEATRPNALFLSTAVQLNSESLQPVFNWFREKLVIFNTEEPLPLDFSIRQLQHKGNKEVIQAFMRAADINISDIQVITRKGLGLKLSFNVGTEEFQTEREEVDRMVPQFQHDSETGSALFDLEDESTGTQRLFALAGPIRDILASGRVLVVDELNSSLHPLLVQHLIALFHNSASNLKGSQLIFTTHDTTLLDTDLFRRDQIWFVEKDHRKQASVLYPLSDFHPRKGEALERAYLTGRYGAIPILNDKEG